MNRIKELVREPALVIDALESGLVLAVALGLFSLTGEAQRDLVALFITILAVGKGFMTRPFPPTVIPDLGRAAFVFFGSVHLTHLTADQITLVATFLGTITTLIATNRISPVTPPPVK